ncbi:Crp/Fnr family transcriptional regulator [Bacillus sp. FJAT-25509]|uniref:DoxX family protein n=1 Tax=Bacillus sp. FJAT-25509 TaxID=1712029 RepID=UPI0006F86CD5|nr:DoxX family protein [Bacillus sp. FJAT-25509]KQL39888.1 Crp/Fnr family transcriptional regulator [Bacillus sp. FJAT-25509]
MFINFLRTNKIASGFLTIIRLYLGYEWIHAGWGKLSTGGFDASGFLGFAVRSATGDHPAVQKWWADFLTNFAIPNIDLFNILVPIGEFAIGLGLILGCFTKTAMFFGLMMNFAFMFSGTTSTNPQMVLLGIFIIIAGSNAGRIGLDHYVSKFINRKTSFAPKVQDHNLRNAS